MRNPYNGGQFKYLGTRNDEICEKVPLALGFEGGMHSFNALSIMKIWIQ